MTPAHESKVPNKLHTVGPLPTGGKSDVTGREVIFSAEPVDFESLLTGSAVQTWPSPITCTPNSSGRTTTTPATTQMVTSFSSESRSTRIGVKELHTELCGLLSSRGGLPEWTAWLDRIVARSLSGPVSGPKRANAARQLMLVWTYYRWATISVSCLVRCPDLLVDDPNIST